MSLLINAALLGKTTSQELEHLRAQASRSSSSIDPRDIAVDASALSDEALSELKSICEAAKQSKPVRAIEAIAGARLGRFDQSLPNFQAFEAVCKRYLSDGPIDGWIYVEGPDGQLYPELVLDVQYSEERRGRSDYQPRVTISTIYYGITHESKMGVVHGQHSFAPQAVMRRKIPEILASNGIYKETAALKEEYRKSQERYEREIRGEFAKQFRVTGSAFSFRDGRYARRGEKLLNRKVVHDMDADSFQAHPMAADSKLFDHSELACEVPIHPLVLTYDLGTQEYVWVHSDSMTAYVYDPSLRDKLILPKTMHDLLDVLTTDINSLTDDFIEGKSAGNVILCQGIPGVGKTLTAEVYSELVQRPLYAVHTGTLGTTAESIQAKLQSVFYLTKRWNAVALIDEADIFVMRRGDSLQQNAIVAEFLRTLEYFDGLLFMTTNRQGDIDEAIVSRCAAIINYSPPSPSDAAAVWHVMAKQFECQDQMSDELVQQLIELFPQIAPRDIKMLLRLVLRMARAQKQPLSRDLFRRCAMFRAVRMAVA